MISRVPNQYGVSLLYSMLEIDHSGWEPSISVSEDVFVSEMNIISFIFIIIIIIIVVLMVVVVSTVVFYEEEEEDICIFRSLFLGPINLCLMFSAA